MTNGNGSGVAKTAITSISDNLKGSPLAFSLVVINGIFILVVMFLLWHVSSAVERRDEIINNFISRCVKTGSINEDRNLSGPRAYSAWSLGNNR